MTSTIVITGISSGIGLATAQLFADRGWNVIGTTRDGSNPLSGNPRVTVVPLDVTDLRAADELATRAAAFHGGVDVLVNNAGYYQMGPLETTSMEQIRAQFETNVFGLIAVTKSFLPLFRRQQRGMIVNLSSISAENGYPFTSVYGASKAAVASLTEALNVELAPVGVVAKAIFPGTHATRIFTKIDPARDFPELYIPLLRRFLDAQTSLTGSPASVAAEVIWRAVTDGRPDKVRYYSGPDATSIPTAKRLMGADRYFAFVKRTITNGPGRVARALTREGGTPVGFDLSEVERSARLDRVA